jgi:hypothetical protein
MKTPRRDRELERTAQQQKFFAWMDELNREAVRCGYADWPLPEETAHGPNCWIDDFAKGLTPAHSP